jgi:hypothetical protein
MDTTRIPHCNAECAEGQSVLGVSFSEDSAGLAGTTYNDAGQYPILLRAYVLRVSLSVTKYDIRWAIIALGLW